MEILWLTENYPPSRGGMAQSCDRLIRQFRRRGIDIHIIHFTNRKRPFNTMAQVNGSYTAIPKSGDMAHRLNQALSFIEHRLALDSIDLIMAFGGFLPITAAPVFSQLLQLPLYLCFRGNDLDLALFNSRRRQTLTDAIHQAEGVFTVSSDKVERIRRLYPNSHVYFSPNGIDTGEWLALKSEQAFAAAWRQEHAPGDQKVLGLFGYLKEKKGVLFFLNALKRTAVKDSVHLLFSGDQEEEVITFMNEHHISYTTLPFTDRVELIKYYVACDWVVIPSFYDGMPNVLLESGALGIPVIASAVDGMKDVITHNENGLLFQPFDNTMLSQQITEAITMTPVSRKHMGDTLRKHIEEVYTVNNEVDNYLTVLEQKLP